MKGKILAGVIERKLRKCGISSHLHIKGLVPYLDNLAFIHVNPFTYSPPR
jgi:hypothetical protein